MPNVTINGNTYELPDESMGNKTALYNALLIAILGAGPDGFGQAWQSWTPTWTNLTVGNGVVVAKYLQIGKLVICHLSIVLGNTSSVGTEVSFSLPVTQGAYGGSNLGRLGTVGLLDASAGPAAFEGRLVPLSTSAVIVRVSNTSGTYETLTPLSATVPFTWTTSDEIGGQFWYEAA